MTQPNTLYFGDDLDILRQHIGDETVDLVCLDPPFNSQRVAIVPALLTVIAFVIRAALEDRTLRAELPGYADYAACVHYRLVPGLW